MKKLFIPLLLIFVIQPAFAQDNLVKKIEVMGTAKKEIVPDEIFLTIALKEYKQNNQKINIEVLEKQLYRTVKNADIPDEDLKIENIYGYNYDWYKKKKDTEFLARKRYILKLNDLNKVNELLSGVDPEGIEYVNINDYSHTKIDEYKQELKIEALKNAREKAQYLLSSIDEELGEAIEIQEVDIGDGPVYPMRADVRMAESAQSMPDIGFRKIELESRIRAIFKIR